MPQMAPLNWLLLISMSSLILMSTLFSWHFLFTQTTKNTTKPTQTPHFQWKW